MEGKHEAFIFGILNGMSPEQSIEYAKTIPIDNDPITVFVSEHGIPIALLRAHVVRTNLSLYYIAGFTVVKELRNTGLGRIIINGMIEIVKEFEGVNRIELESMNNSLMFWEKLGFKAIGKGKNPNDTRMIMYL